MNNKLILAAVPHILCTVYYYESFDLMNLLYLYILSFFALQYYNVIVQLYRSENHEIEYQADGDDQQILNTLFPRPTIRVADNPSQDSALQFMIHALICLFTIISVTVACINKIDGHSTNESNYLYEHMHFMFISVHSFYVFTHGIFGIKPILKISQIEENRYSIKWNPETKSQMILPIFYIVRPFLKIIAPVVPVVKVASLDYNWFSFYTLAGYDILLKNGIITNLGDNRQRIIVKPLHLLMPAVQTSNNQFTVNKIHAWANLLYNQQLEFAERKRPEALVDTPLALPAPAPRQEQPQPSTYNSNGVNQSLRLALLYATTLIASASIMATMTAMSTLTICSLLFGMAFLMFEHLITRVNFHLYDFRLFEHNRIIPTPSSMVHNCVKQAGHQVALTVNYFKPGQAPQ